MHWIVTRTERTDKSTIGKFEARFADGKTALELFVLENPWLDNRRTVSCIPPGTYRLEKRTNSGWNDRHKEKFGVSYVVGVEDVEGRDGIIVHEGNYPRNTDGCLLLGKSKGKDFVGNSVAAVREFYALCDKHGVPPKIEIVEDL